MHVNYRYIDRWLSDHNIKLEPYFSEVMHGFIKRTSFIFKRCVFAAWILQTEYFLLVPSFIQYAVENFYIQVNRPGKTDI